MVKKINLSWFNKGKYYVPVSAEANPGDLLTCSKCYIQIFEGHPLMVFAQMKPEEEIEIFEVQMTEPDPPIKKSGKECVNAFCKECRIGRKITKKSPEMKPSILRKMVAEPMSRLITSIAIRAMDIRRKTNEDFIIGIAGNVREDYCVRMTAVRKLSPNNPKHKEILGRIISTKNENIMVHSTASRRFQGFDPLKEIPAIK